MSETVGEERRRLFHLTGKITLLSDGLLLSIHYQLKVLSLIRNVQNCPWHWIAQRINNLTVSCAFLYLFLKLRIFSGIADCDEASSCLSFLIVGYCTLINAQHLYVHLELNHRRIVKLRTVSHFSIKMRY